uniref:Uncharacterized protein n=1 Tax=Arundo donax TaxID=35708 RepID=A0A0A9ADZ6_ARUDO
MALGPASAEENKGEILALVRGRGRVVWFLQWWWRWRWCHGGQLGGGQVADLPSPPLSLSLNLSSLSLSLLVGFFGFWLMRWASGRSCLV